MFSPSPMAYVNIFNSRDNRIVWDKKKKNNERIILAARQSFTMIVFCTVYLFNNIVLLILIDFRR